MSFDGAFTHAMVGELNQTLAGGRVSKVNQPYDNEIVLTIRANRTSYPLLLSANPTFARIQTTQIPYVNPVVPTNYTMMMRKYLSGAILSGVTQPANDRVVNLDFTSRNELGDQVHLRLIIEIMARHSNVILVDAGDMTILDAIKHVHPDQNRYRTLLPGGTYINPPKQDLRNPFEGPGDELTELIKQYPNETVLAQQLQKTYQGLGKDTALGLARQLHRSDDYAAGFISFFKGFDAPQPTLVTTAKNKTSFTAFPYIEDDGTTTRQFETMSALLDFYYQDRAERDRVQQQGSTLIHVVKNELKKNRTKLKKLNQTMAATENADEFRIKGELLTTYLHQVERGMTSISLPNFYDNEKQLKISLSNQISPSQNAQKYFKKYNKLKNAVAYVTEQIDKTNAEITYLDNIQSQIELAAPKDLADIKLELQQGGYLRDHDHRKNQKKKRQRVSKPEIFQAEDGTKIEVGKNNLQNEQLTLHSAAKTDVWLHVKNMPGSHVIIHDQNPSDETLLAAANIAAYYSKARQSSSVPVDYVHVKKIKKPNGTKPGFVIYEGQKTMYVTPDRSFVEGLLVKA